MTETEERTIMNHRYEKGTGGFDPRRCRRSRKRWTVSTARDEKSERERQLC